MAAKVDILLAAKVDILLAVKVNMLSSVNAYRALRASILFLFLKIEQAPLYKYFTPKQTE
jgi:hypothetical protein